MTIENNDSVNELITKHLAGETSADEQKQLASWLSENLENRRYFDNYKKAFDLAEQHFSNTDAENLPINVDKEWDYFTEAAALKTRVQNLPSPRMWLRVAAAVLLIVAAGSVLYYSSSESVMIYQTAGIKQAISLPDGSHVTLNRNTTLSYEPGFGDENRTVSLKGEAFFDVQPDITKPFIVLTGTAKVQVLGTSFNVNAYDSLSNVEVVVQTGIVSLETNRGEKKVKVAAGAKGIYNKINERVTSDANKDANFQSWNTQRLVFNENDLQSVIETLKRTYHVEIKVRTHIPATCVVTVTFENQSLESVLRVLENTLNLKYTRNGNQIEITDAGC